MKVSKVNHVKAGVNETPIEGGGILYDYPSKTAETKNLESHIEGLNRKAQNLYSVFTPSKEEDFETATEIAKSYFGIIINQFKIGASDDAIVDTVLHAGDRTIKYKYDRKEGGKSRKVSYESCEKKVSFIYVPDGTADHVVDMSLRQSLRRTYKDDESGEKIYVPDIIKAITRALFSGDYDGRISLINRDELLLVIKALREDFTKKKQIELIIDSIEKQNAPVQVSKDGKRVILSSAYNPKKSYIFKFLTDYAGASKDEQNQMLKHMHYLIVLYYSGVNSISEKDIKNPWKVDALVKTFDGPFSDELYDLILTCDNIPRENKAEIRKTNDEIRKEISNEIVRHYQVTTKMEGLSPEDKSWIGYISDYASKLLTEKRLDTHKVTISYLCKKTWEEWLSFIAKKYIEMGKGAYRFALDGKDIAKVCAGEEVALGEIAEEYKNGISSFDYERMSADDSLKRSLSKYVSFALNNFDSSVREYNEREKVKREDILSCSDSELVLRNDAKKRALRYFGGMGNYMDTEIVNLSDPEVVNAIKSELKVARNSSFHFVSGESKIADRSIIEMLFSKENMSVGAIYRKKYYSNNVPMFYSVSDINSLMDELYSSSKTIKAQIPSFNKVLSRNAVAEFANSYLLSQGRSAISDVAVAEKFRSAFYFVLKEIYYYDFVKRTDLTERFRKALKDSLSELNDSREDKKKKEAHKAFLNRFDELIALGNDFPSVCQEIMTEYNLQNNQKKKKPSGIRTQVKVDKNGKPEYETKPVKDESQIYRNYRTLLQLGIRDAFKSYLKENANRFGFLQKPENRSNLFEKMSEGEFCNNWNTDSFEYLKEEIFSDNLSASWYVAAHFLDQKNLNHLLGTLKNYVQFIEDIEKRAKATGNRYKDVSEIANKYLKLVDVLEFVKMFCGAVSNRISDYFTDDEEYAKYISYFVDYGAGDTVGLKAFCSSNAEARYYDAMNPIPNRNIILSSMYGNARILSKSMCKLEEKDFKELSKVRGKVSDILKCGVCTTIDEQRKLRHYQNLKNRIEMVDVLTLTELMSDLQGQLISYSYLRERDLMYMQLGYYYTKLFHTDSVTEESQLRTVGGGCNIKDGAVLYEIMAMYSYDLPFVLVKDGGIGVLLEPNMQTGIKVSQFTKSYSADAYMEGLCFFEDSSETGNYKRHDEFVKFRDYIDHFKYFATPNKSIMEMYSKIYDGFFSYDIKLKKSVSYIITNILLSYFVNATLSFEKGMDSQGHNMTLIVPELKTDYFTFKPGKIETKIEATKEETTGGFDLDMLKARMNGGSYQDSAKNEKKNTDDNLFEARNNQFLDEVKRMLTYCEKSSK